MYLRSFICSWIIAYYVFSYLTIWSAILFVPFWWVLMGERPNLLCTKCQRIDENCNKYFLCFFQWLKTLQIRHCFFLLLSWWQKLTTKLCKILAFSYLFSWVFLGSVRFFGVFLWACCGLFESCKYIKWGVLGFSTSGHIIWNNLR